MVIGPYARKASSRVNCRSHTGSSGMEEGDGCPEAQRLVQNGCVGDWRLKDDAFMESFHLPKNDDKLETLRERNPFPREKRIHFDEESHTYTIDGKFVVPRSATKLLHQYTNDFNAEIVLSEMRARPSWEWKRDAYITEVGDVMYN